MTLVYTHENLTIVMNMNAVLQLAGIKTQVKNEYAVNLAGEVPSFEVWPEIWVENHFMAAQAKEIVASQLAKENQPDWQCSHCGEPNGATFDFCWQCETPK